MVTTDGLGRERAQRRSPAGDMMRSRARGTLEYLRDAVFNYPTLAEASKAAALNGLNGL